MILRQASTKLRKAWRPLGVAVALALAVVLGAVTGAAASIPDSSGTIHACYRNTTGELRVIDTGAAGSCYGDETALNWSQSGLHYFTGSATSDSNSYVSATCSDGGLPVVLYVQQPGDQYWWSNFHGTADQGERLILNSSGQPDGLAQYVGTANNPNFSYLLICS